MTLVDCPKCDGNGSYYFAGGNLDCSWCRGTGKMEDKDAQDYTDNRNKAYNNASDLIHNTDGFIDGSDVPTSGIYESKASLKAMKDLGAGDFAGDIPDDMDLDEWLGEAMANEVPYSDRDKNEWIWTCPKCSQQIDYITNKRFPIDHLRSHGLSDENIEQILTLDFSSSWKMKDFLNESKASEDFVTYDIDGNVITRKEEPDGTFEDMMARSDDPEKTLNAWNNIVRILEEEEQKKSTESKANEFQVMCPKCHNTYDTFAKGGKCEYCGVDNREFYGMESKATEGKWNDLTPDMKLQVAMHHNLGGGDSGVKFEDLSEEDKDEYVLKLIYAQTMGKSLWGVESKASEAGRWDCPVCGSRDNRRGAWASYGKPSKWRICNQCESPFNADHEYDDEEIKKIADVGNMVMDGLPQNKTGWESKASEYSIKEEFDLQDQDGKYEMLSKADLSVTDATNYSTYSHDELPEEVKDSLKGDEDSYGESWSRKSSIDKIEALERLGIKQGDAIQLSGLEFEDYAEDLQGALKGEVEEGDVEDARKQMQYDKWLSDTIEKDSKYSKDDHGITDPHGLIGSAWQKGGEVDNPNSEFDQNYPDYNNIGKSQTSRTKYECEYCDHGFKSNEALSIHYNDKHAIAPESLDGYDYAEKPYWLKLQERTIIHKNFDPIWGSPDRANDDDLHEYGNPESSEGDTLKCSHCGQIFNPDNEQVLYSHLAGHGITESKASETISDYEREQRRLNYEEELTEEEKSTKASYFNKLHNDNLDRKNKQFMEDEQVFGEPEEMYGMLGMESKASESILAGRSIEEYLQEYGMTREEGEQVAEYAGMDLKELIEIGNFDEARHHRVQDMDVSYMYEESKASEALDPFEKDNIIDDSPMEEQLYDLFDEEGGDGRNEWPQIRKDFCGGNTDIDSLVSGVSNQRSARGIKSVLRWADKIFKSNESKANEFGDYEVKCDTCDGKGYELEWSGSKQEYFEDPCDTCGGKGTNTWTSKVGKSDESKASEGEGLPYAMGNYTDWFSQAWGDDADQSAIPNTVQCEDCFDQFNVENQQGMINHINSKHDANIDPVTGESKASEAGLDDHSCPECGFITSDNSDYVDHLNAHEE